MVMIGWEWTVNNNKVTDNFYITALVLQGSKGKGRSKKMKLQRPDLMVIISFVFVIGTVATSLTANSEDKNIHPQISQNIIR